MAYRLCCPPNWPHPPELEQKIVQLQELNQGEQLFQALDRFVALLSLPQINPHQAIRQTLEDWVKRRVGQKWDQLQQEIQLLLTELCAEENEPFDSHLLIYVKDESSDPRSVSALYIHKADQYDPRIGTGSIPLQAPASEPFAEKVTRETLPSLIQTCLSEVLSQDPKNLTVHLFLPIPWLQADCDCWPVLSPSKYSFLPDNSVDAVGVQFNCVVRMTERLNPGIFNLYHQSWSDKWQILQTQHDQVASAVFVPGDEFSIEDGLYKELDQPEKVGVKLSKAYQEQQYQRFFGTLIASGIPAALWVRHERLSDDLAVAAELENLLNCQLSELPETIQASRKRAQEQDDKEHLGQHLAFLWSDPNIVPPKQQLSMGM